MTWSASHVSAAYKLYDAGVPVAVIASRIGVSRGAVRSWLESDREALLKARRARGAGPVDHGAACPFVQKAPPATYAYLLGQYLGDGCLSEARRNVFKLRITCCQAYPQIMEECERAIHETIPASKVGHVQRLGCIEVYSYSKHWICLFPQHGPGRKHDRRIELAAWQQAIVDEHPKPFLRGLVHSDGCRSINRVGGRDYSRYHFSNRSDDIRALFGQACDRMGIDWRTNGDHELSVARRGSVAILDSFIGPKT